MKQIGPRHQLTRIPSVTVGVLLTIAHGHSLTHRRGEHEPQDEPKDEDEDKDKDKDEDKDGTG